MNLLIIIELSLRLELIREPHCSDLFGSWRHLKTHVDMDVDGGMYSDEKEAKDVDGPLRRFLTTI